jgi:hypothetical protein
LGKFGGRIVVLFAFPLTIPANTSDVLPFTQTLTLDFGVITKISIKFPAGCHGLVQVQLLQDESVLVPQNGDTWLNGDDETIESEIYFEFDSPPYALKFVGISPGTTYNHTILVRVEILSADEAFPSVAMTDLVQILTQYLRIPQTVALE